MAGVRLCASIGNIHFAVGAGAVVLVAVGAAFCTSSAFYLAVVASIGLDLPRGPIKTHGMIVALQPAWSLTANVLPISYSFPSFCAGKSGALLQS